MRALTAGGRILGGCRRGARGEEGQMVAELAVVAPAMIAVALVVLNLMLFLGAVARFDRIAPDAVMAVAVSPSGDDAQTGDQSSQVAAAIAEAMGGGDRVSVEVSARSAWEAGGQEEGALGFSFAPHLTRYECVLRYAPWPSRVSIAGFEAGLPLAFEHTRSFTVDRYRPGVFF